MKITKTRLNQIIQEETEATLREWDPGTVLTPEEPVTGELPRSFSEEPPGTVDLAEFSPSEAFGMAWTKAIEFLKSAGMEEAAQVLEKESGGDQEELNEVSAEARDSRRDLMNKARELLLKAQKTNDINEKEELMNNAFNLQVKAVEAFQSAI